MPYDPRRHGPQRVVGPGFHARVFAVVRKVPRGRVTTYGDVAAVLGRRGVARHVGNAMSQCPDGVAWHRVVNAQGRVSARADGRPSTRQIALLRRDGVDVDDAGRVMDFARRRFRVGCPSNRTMPP
ncbi:MAG: MGMT family protein [Planctomycetota bacterium]